MPSAKEKARRNELINAQRENSADNASLALIIGASVAGIGFLFMLLYTSIIPGCVLDGGWMAVLTPTVGMGLFGAAIMYRMFKYMRNLWTHLLVGTLFLMVGIGHMCFTTLHSINRLASDEPVTLSGTVTSKRPRRGSKNPKSTVQLAETHNTGLGVIEVSGGYDQHSRITVTVRKGLLGWYWVELIKGRKVCER